MSRCVRVVSSIRVGLKVYVWKRCLQRRPSECPGHELRVEATNKRATRVKTERVRGIEKNSAVKGRPRNIGASGQGVKFNSL